MLLADLSNHVPKWFAAIVIFGLAASMYWSAWNPQRARGSEAKQADFRRRQPFVAAMTDSMSNRVLRVMLLLVGTVLLALGVAYVAGASYHL